MFGKIFWLGHAVITAMLCTCMVSDAMADSFGTGPNQFTIDFVKISGDAGDLGSWPADIDRNVYTFTGVNRSDYRMGVYEITNDQWNKFKTSLGVPVTGSTPTGYSYDPSWTGANIPTNRVSLYEAAQFVNWLNTSTGHQAAYKFTGTQGTADYTMALWSPAEAAGGTNLYRHKDAYYYIPTEDEWMKAAYWNGSSLQTFATPGDAQPERGVDCNVLSPLSALPEPEPWDVGSGSEELNGTFDMMGNIWEYTESLYQPWLGYGIGYGIALRGGSYGHAVTYATSLSREGTGPGIETDYYGFRVASEVPEPATISLLCLGGLALIKRRRR